MCQHQTFNAQVSVNRIEGTAGTVHVDIVVRCAECGAPVEFTGVPSGLSWSAPTVSADGTELRAPGVVEGSDLFIHEEGSA